MWFVFSTKSAEESVLRTFKEARRNTPSVIYWPNVGRWWDTAHEVLQTSITLLINDIPPDCPILLIATSDKSMECLNNEVQAIFGKYSFHNCNRAITVTQRRNFWTQIKVPCTEKPKHKPKPIEGTLFVFLFIILVCF